MPPVIRAQSSPRGSRCTYLYIVNIRTSLEPSSRASLDVSPRGKDGETAEDFFVEGVVIVGKLEN